MSTPLVLAQHRERAESGSTYVQLRIAAPRAGAYGAERGPQEGVVFDKTLATTYRWLDDLGNNLGWHDRERSYRALRAVLHALRDRLPVGEAVDLGASLPMLVRGFYYEGWRPSATPRRYRDKGHFLEQVHHDAPWLDADDVESVVTGTFALLKTEIGGDEPEHVRRLLPPEIRELWARPSM